MPTGRLVRVRAVTAVHDGYALHRSVARGPLGGALLSRCMLASLGARGTLLRPPHAFRRVQGPPPAGQWEVRAKCASHMSGSQVTCVNRELARDITGPGDDLDNNRNGFGLCSTPKIRWAADMACALSAFPAGRMPFWGIQARLLSRAYTGARVQFEGC